MSVELRTGTLFKVRIHTSELAYAGEFEVQDGIEVVVEPPRQWGYCGLDDPPTAGEAMVLEDQFAYVLAGEDDCDEEGNLILSEGVSPDDVEIEAVEWNYGDWASDGTAWLVFVDEDTYALTV